MEETTARVSVTNDLNIDLLAGCFEADYGYDIQDMNSDQVHIRKMHQNGRLEDFLVSRKPTYKGGSLFEVYSLASGGGSTFNAGMKLGQMVSGRSNLSPITDLIQGLDEGLILLKKIIAAKGEPASVEDNFEPADLTYRDFDRLRRKYQNELRAGSNDTPQGQHTSRRAATNSGPEAEFQWQWYHTLGAIFLVITLINICGPSK